MEKKEKLSFADVKNRIGEHLKTVLNIEDFSIPFAKQVGEAMNSIADTLPDRGHRVTRRNSSNGSLPLDSLNSAHLACSFSARPNSRFAGPQTHSRR